MTDETYGGSSALDRNEMFAIGAAAGALIATAIQEMLERRRKTPIERARERASGIVEESGAYVSGLSKRGRKQLKQAQKAARKQAKQRGEQVGKLKEAATGALGVAATAGVVEKVLEAADFGGKNAKRDRSWFRRASEAAQEQLETAREAVQDVRPAKKQSSGWWNAATAQKPSKQSRGWWNMGTETKHDSKTNGKLAAGAAVVGAVSARSVLDTMREYVEGAREAVSDAALGAKAREAAAGARGRIEDAKLSDRARVAAETASSTLKEAAETARERLEDAKLRERARDYAGVAGVTVKDYGNKAGKAARVSAERLSEGASQVAGSTAVGAKEVRKGVKKRVKKTRRRVNWGLRAFIVGLVVGLLSAPQSGERTRQTVQGFLENLLDLVLPDEQTGGGAGI